MSSSPRARRLEARKLVKVIRAGVPEEDLDNYLVGLAGSQALAMCGNRHKNTRPDKFAWADALEPNDCDLFVCGHLGENAYVFEDYVGGVICNIQRSGMVIKEVTRKLNNYIHQACAVLIADIWVEGLGVKLSFVQCPFSNTVHEVVAGFDLNIVKVVYDFKSGDFIAEENTMKMMADGDMEVSRHILDELDAEIKSNGPPGFRFRKLKSSYFRIAKYVLREFNLKNEDAVMEKFGEALAITYDDYDGLCMRGEPVHHEIMAGPY